MAKCDTKISTNDKISNTYGLNDDGAFRITLKYDNRINRDGNIARKVGKS